MTDFILRAFLLTTHEFFIVALITFGYLMSKSDVRPIFGRALMILTFTMVFNPWLKSLWQIPLLPSLGKVGWSFPSGHTQAAFALYGWLAWEFRQRWLYLTVLVLLGGIGWGLVHFGYHRPVDIPGGILFGLISFLAYYYVLQTPLGKKQNLPLLGLLLFAVGWGFVAAIPGRAPAHMAMAQGALLGFSLGCLWNKRFTFLNWPVRLFNVALALGGASTLNFMFSDIKSNSSEFLAHFLLEGMVAFWIIGCAPKLGPLLLRVKHREQYEAS